MLRLPPLGKTLLLVLATVLSIPAIAVASDPQSSFSETLDLVEVEVDLVVTDRKGRPVTDLERGDFELYHDGARHEILYLERPLHRSVTARDEGGGRQRRVVVYADNLRIWPKRRNAMLRRLDSFLEERIARGDRVSVVAFDGAVELLVVDSGEIGRVRAALDTLASRPTAMARLAMEARQLRLALAEGIDASVLQPRIERYVELLSVDAGRSVAGLAATIQAIARPRGADERVLSTSILYLSDGIPAWPGDELRELTSGSGSPRVSVRFGPGDSTSQGVPTPTVQYLVTLPSSPIPSGRMGEEPGTVEFLEPLLRVANAHDVAFYPVRPSAFFHPSIRGSQIGPGERVDFVGTLRWLASSTGGDLVPYGGFEAALTRLSSRLDSTYALGFQISPDREHVAHTLEVQLARKGMQAHYRRGYALDPRRATPPATPTPAQAGRRGAPAGSKRREPR